MRVYILLKCDKFRIYSYCGFNKNLELFLIRFVCFRMVFFVNKKQLGSLCFLTRKYLKNINKICYCCTLRIIIHNKSACTIVLGTFMNFQIKL